MKITIIGAGNMGGATAMGLAKAGKISPSDITVTARHEATLEKFKSLGIQTSTDNLSAVRGADYVIIAVKPWIVEDVCSQIKEEMDYSSQKVLCMAPGVKPADLEDYLTRGGEKPSIFYVIPNTAIEECESMTFICATAASPEEAEDVDSIFEGTGLTMVVDYPHLMAGTALASCGIAYALRYIRAAAEGGVELGTYAKDSTLIVAQTVKGAASLLLEHKSHPEAEIDKVTTPGGMTIKGLNAMEEAGFTNAVIKGLKAGK